VEDEKGNFVTTLLFPNEYARQLNQVSGLTTKELIYLKRRFLSRSGYELVSYPLADCIGITYKDERPILSIAWGVILTSVLGVLMFMILKYWNDLPPATRVPVGAIMVTSLYGFRMVFAARRHRLLFQMSDGRKLIWKSRAGDYKYKEASAAKVVELAKSRGILTAST
jgi:hypothetical protein